MNDNNFHIKIKNDYSDDEVFIGLINKYYSKSELDVATKRMNNIIYPIVKEEVEKYQIDLKQKYNQELIKLQLDYKEKTTKEYKLIEEEKNKNTKLKKHIFISFFIVIVLYLMFFILMAFNI